MFLPVVLVVRMCCQSWHDTKGFVLLTTFLMAYAYLFDLVMTEKYLLLYLELAWLTVWLTRLCVFKPLAKITFL